MITRATREAVLQAARYRCCLHRIAWFERVADDPHASKWQPLEVHHVIFQSCGGSDEPENLVPLCPSCHTIIHSTRRLGAINVDDEMLRSLWALWQTIGTTVGRTLHIGKGPRVRSATIQLNAYGLEIHTSVDDTTLFFEARRSLLESTIGVLESIDPHFPFPRGRVEPVSWETSLDDIGRPWNEHTAAEVFASSTHAITLKAPVVITLDRQHRPQLGGNDEQRTA